MRKLVLFAMLAGLAPGACAQRVASGTGAHFAAPVRHGSPAVSGVRSNFAFGREAHSPSRFLRTAPFGPEFFPLLEDWSSPADLYAAGYPVASQLPYFVMQGGSPAIAELVDRQPEAPSESLLIELQGDRYVRVNGNQAESANPPLTLQQDQPQVFSGKGKRSAQSSSHDSVASQSSTVATNPAIASLPPVVLVLRDGTRQEVRDYTIADGALYARGDFYTDGYWNKTIRLSTVNVAETLSANNSRGVKFVLPSAPNEVITRP